jgi:lysyl-tRNA synthetase class 2
VRVAGRMLAKRIMGKASFAQIQDISGRIQLFLQASAGRGLRCLQDLGHRRHRRGRGRADAHRTGELSIKCDSLRLLTKSLRRCRTSGMACRCRAALSPALRGPDRQPRSAPGVRDALADHPAIRHWLDARRFLEVETPMMHYIPAAPPHARSSPTTTRWISSCTCASRRSCTSSAWWSAASSGSTRSTATSATRACPPGTIPSSPCSSCTRPTPPTRDHGPDRGLIRDVASRCWAARQVEWDGAQIDLGPGLHAAGAWTMRCSHTIPRSVRPTAATARHWRALRAPAHPVKPGLRLGQAAAGDLREDRRSTR